ncbi:MAG TPA: hypothetical protein VLB44_05410 [Kofleriaceae bacterium]|nr:hypothetical protein [Kofleriaceae bacterium]
MWLAILAAGAANIGTNVHLPPADTLDLAVDLGGQWIRIDLNWDTAEPAENQWNWAPFDAVIDGAKARGLKVYATLAYTPAWASTGNRRGDGNTNDVPVTAKYRAFVEAAVARYKTKVDVFGTWNEPNLADFFEGSRTEWIDSVYTPAVLGIRAQCPTCTIAGPEVATIGSVYGEYVQAALAAQPPTILSAHIYASFPEDDSSAGVTKDSFYNKLEKRRVIGPWSGPISIREAQIAAGQTSLPVWITETGEQSPVGDAAKLETQRLYYQRVLDAMDSRSWWGGTIFYEMSEEHPNGMWPDVHWGIALRTSDPDATPLDDFQVKPAYSYLKTRLAQTPPAAGDAGVADDAGGGGGPGLGNDAGTGDDPQGMASGCGCGATPISADTPIMIAAAGVLLRRRRRR